MITDTDSLNTIDLGKYYAILLLSRLLTQSKNILITTKQRKYRLVSSITQVLIQSGKVSKAYVS